MRMSEGKENVQVQLSEHEASAVPQAPGFVGTSLSHDHLPIGVGCDPRSNEDRSTIYAIYTYRCSQTILDLLVQDKIDERGHGYISGR